MPLDGKSSPPPARKVRKPVLAADAQGDELAGLELFRHVPLDRRWLPSASTPKKPSTITIGDSVRIRYLDEDEEDGVTIVDGPSDPDGAVINAKTILAIALLGAGVGEVRTVALPAGARFVEVVSVIRND